ncbi:MAG: ERCC4 domain-containing protein [Christensenellales bacterium]|jgi:hypothetical protein
MQVQVDSREKSRAIKKILEEFDKQDVKYFVSKLYVGDYVDLENPLVFIDRKQNVAEIAQNATSGHARVKRELERLKDIGGKMYFLIEQDRIGNKKIESLEDIMLWKPKYGTINGMQIYRILKAWLAKYDIEYVFCSKRNTGKEIIRLLGGVKHE